MGSNISPSPKSGISNPKECIASWVRAPMYVPDPALRSSNPSSSRRRIARITVRRELSNCLLNSKSLGSLTPLRKCSRDNAGAQLVRDPLIFRHGVTHDISMDIIVLSRVQSVERLPRRHLFTIPAVGAPKLPDYLIHAILDAILYIYKSDSRLNCVLIFYT